MKSFATKRTLLRRNAHRHPMLFRLIMCACLFFIFSMNTLSAQEQNQRLSLNLKQTSLENVLRQIEQQTNFHFLYNNNFIDVDKKVDIQVSNVLITEILGQLFKDGTIKYQIKDNQIILSPKTLVKNEQEDQQKPLTRKISGKVIDEDGYEVPGVTIAIAGTTKGTTTDVNGEFSLTLSMNEKALIFSCVGMLPETISVKNKTHIEVKLKYNRELLNELIVTGYQTISKEQSTGSYVTISPSSLEGKLQTNIISRLEGQVPGLLQNKGKLSLRGIVSLKGETQPLYVVDGTPFEGNIKSLNPSIIENITILKDAAAASIYGARAANGVIVISTKKGAIDGKTHVSYEASIKASPKPDINYLDRINSRELVDLQVSGFGLYTEQYDKLSPRAYLNPVLELLYKHKAKKITDQDLETGLNVYRELDNREQISNELLQTGLTHQHNVTLSGGSEKNRYITSLNYVGDYGNMRHTKDEQIGFTFRNNVQFFSWLKSDFGVAGTFSTQSKKNVETTFDQALNFSPSYSMLRDTNGNPAKMMIEKSDYELKRLIKIGLQDETYIPLRDMMEESTTNKNNYYRAHAGLNIKLSESLNIDVNYQTEYASGKIKKLATDKSYLVRSIINNAAQYDEETKKLTLNIPEGGYLREERNDLYSYTLRTQLNYTKNVSDHYISGLLGAERRLVRRTSTGTYFLGYDDTGLGHKPINPLIMNPIIGTQDLQGHYYFTTKADQYLKDKEDRFVSFYGNAAYSYLSKYKLTGSIRIDQSNLFGTDPKYQYRPLWSVGAGWNIMQEPFMEANNWISILEVRGSYGIGGNIPKDVGPYLTLLGPEYSQWHNDFELYLHQPPNPRLRWEKTASTNIGLDFGFLNNRITGSIELYNKYTTDLLGYRETDGTRGWERQMINYGKMRNTGIDFSLNTINIETENLTWSTGINFNYNRNRVLDINDAEMSINGYLGDNVFVKGYPAYSLFSTKFAGLNEKGVPLFYDADGNKREELTSISDLVHAGTTVPPYNASFSSNFNYKNFGLSLLFVYYGGHILRDVPSPILSFAPTSNVTREVLNVWKKPGDENNPNATPAFTGSYTYREIEQPWHASDRYVLKGDYIKLRDISFTYNFGRSVLSKLNLESMMATLQIQNLFSWYANKRNFDPETSSIVEYSGAGVKSLPIPPTYTLGISINF